MYTGIVETEVYTKKIRESLFYKKITDVTVKESNINLEKDIFEKTLLGQLFIYINRKSDVINLTTGNAVNYMIRLGVNGRMYLAAKEESFDKDYILKLEFIDGRRFYITGDKDTQIEVVDEQERKDYYEKLVADPLDNALTIEPLNAMMMNFEGSISDALVSGKYLGGIDPLYAHDILVAAGIDAQREAGDLNMKEANQLFVAIQTVLQSAMAADGKITEPFSKNDQRVGRYQSQAG